MKYAILYSKKDEAGKNIASQLKNFFLPQVPIIELQKESIFSENIDEHEEQLEKADLIIFATKHKSSANVPSLSVHAPGNWRNADFGGKPSKVCKTSSQAIKFLFQKLSENAKSVPELGHNITLECTHHGPFLEKVPCCFIEIGSNEEHWKDKKLGEIIARTIADFQDFKPDRKIKSAIGIGGPHYCPNFSKIQLNSKEYAIGHIIPEYALPLNESMIKEAVEKTIDGTDLIILDWKGCGNSESRKQIIQTVESLGLKHERTERILK